MIIIKPAKPEAASDIARLIHGLMNEIMNRTGGQHFCTNINETTALCCDYLKNNEYLVVGAFDGDMLVGVGTICESRSLYAGGTLGIIQELYVMPEFRSQQVGRKLIRFMSSIAKEKKWKRLEVCTPPVPIFDKTVSFYEANGFDLIHGRKMRRVIS